MNPRDHGAATQVLVFLYMRDKYNFIFQVSVRLLVLIQNYDTDFFKFDHFIQQMPQKCVLSSPTHIEYRQEPMLQSQDQKPSSALY